MEGGRGDLAAPAVLAPLTTMDNSLEHSLAGKVALVAGATRGAGRGIAVQLGAAGATARSFR